MFACLLIQCETYGTVALDALYTELLQPPTKVSIIGSGCSLAIEPTAQVSHYYNIKHVRYYSYVCDRISMYVANLSVSFMSCHCVFVLQMSCTSSSEGLSNRTRFRNYFQLLPIDSDLAHGFFGIIMRFKWKRVAIILQKESLFQKVQEVSLNRTPII